MLNIDLWVLGEPSFHYFGFIWSGSFQWVHRVPNIDWWSATAHFKWLSATLDPRTSKIHELISSTSCYTVLSWPPYHVFQHWNETGFSHKFASSMSKEMTKKKKTLTKRVCLAFFHYCENVFGFAKFFQWENVCNFFLFWKSYPVVDKFPLLTWLDLLTASRISFQQTYLEQP